ncbi:MAG: hypothetical protein H6993_07040 [Pseudomonadales bacterium]|nr:hypothetical protein [Pseudomonadales bacterium]
MSIQDLGSIGELLGSIAVLITIVYLAVQIRQNTRALHTATRETSISRTIDFARNFAKDPQQSELYLSGLQNYPDMGQPDKFRFEQILFSLAVDWVDQQTNYNEGQLDQDYWSGNIVNMKGVFNTPGGRQWFYSKAAASLPKKFVDFVEREIVDGAA